MADLIARVTSTGPHAPLAGLVTSSLGLDVWEVKPDYVVLQAGEAQAERLEAMGYGVEQLQLTEAYLSDFATDEAVTGYHSAAGLEDDLRQLAEDHPEIAELHRIGTQRGGPADLGAAAGGAAADARKVAFLGCHHAREWISVEVPYLLAEHLLANSSTDPVQRWLPAREIWVAPMVNPDGHEFTRTETGSGARTGGGTPTAASASTPTATTATCGARSTSAPPATSRRDETYVGPRAFSEPEIARGARPGRPRALRRGPHLPQLLAADPVPVGLHRRADRGPGRPRRAERARRGHAAADQGRARPDLHRAAVVGSSTRRPATRRTGPTASTASRRSPSSCGRPRPRRAGSSCRRARSSRPGRRTGRPRSSSSSTSSTGRPCPDRRLRWPRGRTW